MSPKKQNSDGYIHELYHYTNKEGCRFIEKYRKITYSLGRYREDDFGNGILLTSLKPDENDRMFIANYIWGQYLGPKKYRLGETDYYVKIFIQSSDKRLSSKCYSGRDIFLYEANKLDLNLFTWESGFIYELYHYTNWKGFQSIKRNRRINASTDSKRDVVFGEGIYLTSLIPDIANKMLIAKNNWGPDLGPVKYGLGFTDYYIKIFIPSTDECLLSECHSGRNIFLYRATNIDLNLFAWKPGKTPGDTMSSIAKDSNHSSNLQQVQSSATDTDGAALLVSVLAAVAVGVIAVGKFFLMKNQN